MKIGSNDAKNASVHQQPVETDRKYYSLLAPFEELTQQICSLTASAGNVIPLIRTPSHLLEKRAESAHIVKT